MNKEYTACLKGIAILLMVYLHLFNNLENDLALGYWFSIGDTPLIYYLSRMSNPVSFFLVLSGYGLYASYQKRGEVRPLKRVGQLYAHLWIIYLLLLPLASWLQPDLFPGSLGTFIRNVTSFDCTYIGEQWFFLPYVLLMALSKWIFRLFDRLRAHWVFLLALASFGVTSLLVKMYGVKTLSANMWFYNVYLVFYMLLPFTLGYMAKKYRWLETLRGQSCVTSYGRWLVPSLLVLLCVGRCCTANVTFDPFYGFAFILLFSLLPLAKLPAKLLSYLGRHSMNIWLIHTWFSTRLFHDFFYDQLYVPLLMYLVLLGISLALSHVVELIYRPVGGLLERVR